MEVINKLLICPACDNDNLNKLDYKLICINCDREYMIRDNIPLMFFQTDWNNTIPKVKPFSPFTINEKLFKYNPKGNTIDHFIVQLSSIINGYREGGLFIMIGKKK